MDELRNVSPTQQDTSQRMRYQAEGVFVPGFRGRNASLFAAPVVLGTGRAAAFYDVRGRIYIPTWRRYGGDFTYRPRPTEMDIGLGESLIG